MPTRPSAFHVWTSPTPPGAGGNQGGRAGATARRPAVAVAQQLQVKIATLCS